MVNCYRTHWKLFGDTIGELHLGTYTCTTCLTTTIAHLALRQDVVLVFGAVEHCLVKEVYRHLFIHVGKRVVVGDGRIKET